jgi:hypothetical protein
MSKQSSNIPKPAIFLHIPKTAGTTLHDIIERQYAHDTIYTFGSDAHAAVKEFKNLSFAEREKIQLLRGHMAFGLHEFLPATNQYFTVLRDPVQRVISYYNFILRTPDHYLYEVVQTGNLSLFELLKSELPLMMNDAQVRLLSGVWGDVGFGEVSRAMLQTAVRNLEQYFLVVGLTKEFDKTLFLLRKSLNWRSDTYYERKNVTRQGTNQRDLSVETIDLIKQKNQMDIALYQFARSLFIRQIKDQGLLFPFKVKVFQVRNWWQPIYRQYRHYSIRSSIQSKIKK